MKILTTALAALLLVGAQGGLHATDADKKVEKETKTMAKDEKSLEHERAERNDAVKDLRKDSVRKAGAQTELDKDKAEGKEDDLKQDKKDVKHFDKAIEGDKKDLASQQNEVNKAHVKVRKTAKRLHKAKVVQKAEDAKP